jgi:hypothetical protein
MFGRFLAAVAISGIFSVHVFAGDYISVKKIELKPDENQVRYVGKGEKVVVSFKNTGRPDFGFNEPPFLIGRIGESNTCLAGENGGIWVTGGMYFSNDERLIILRAYSGSSEYFEFYEANNCKKIVEVDMSEIEIGAEINFKRQMPKQLIAFVNKNNE